MAAASMTPRGRTMVPASSAMESSVAADWPATSSSTTHPRGHTVGVGHLRIIHATNVARCRGVALLPAALQTSTSLFLLLALNYKKFLTV
jgi:hypothetical protein